MISTNSELVKTIRAFQDEGYSGFRGFPQTHAEAAVKWANVAETLLAGVVPASTTVTAARATFLSIMAPLSSNGGGLLLLQNAFMGYATTLAGGMTGAGFVGTPPLTPPLISTIFAGNGKEAAAVYANNLATMLVTWAKTGTATPLSGGSPINWN